MTRSKSFGRVIELEIEDRDSKEITKIGNLKIDINVQKQVSTEPSVAYVEIYNLSKNLRDKIHFRFDFFNEKVW